MKSNKNLIFNARKIAEEALRKEKEFSESLIQIANIILVGLNSEGKINLFSKAAETVTGYTFEELKDKDWFETVVPREKYPQVWEEFNRVNQKGEILKIFESPILTKSGTERIMTVLKNIPKSSSIHHKKPLIFS